MSSINQNGENKYNRLDRTLIQAGVDALVCMLAENVVYLTGTYPVHGVGYRYHESIPLLGRGMDGILEKGMVTSVEPGVYIPGFGGIRIKDDLAVGENGPLWLSGPTKPL